MLLGLRRHQATRVLISAYKMGPIAFTNAGYSERFYAVLKHSTLDLVHSNWNVDLTKCLELMYDSI